VWGNLFGKVASFTKHDWEGLLLFPLCPTRV